MMFRALTILLLSCVVGLSAPPPLLRNSWTTNTAGTPVKGFNDLSVTNGSVAGTNWEFFGIGPNTVARLKDITNSIDFNGDASLTNSSIVGLTAGRVSSSSGNTNLIKTLSAGNAIILTNDIGGTNIMIAVDQMAPIAGSMTNLPMSISSITHIIDEEFVANVTSSGLIGRENWGPTSTGGGLISQHGVGGDWEPGIMEMIVTNAADRAGAINDSQTTGSLTATTNMEIYCLSKVRVGLTNTATDQDGFFVGTIGPTLTAEPTDGIYFRLTNNIWEVCTSRASSRTSLVTLSNCVPMTWYNLAWHLDSTGTNVNFYIGMTPTNLVFQTNLNLTIPNTTKTTPAVTCRKIVGATTRMTNWVDYYHMWVRRLR